MADESAERRAPPPGCSGQPAPEGGPEETGQVSNRRRIMMASLLAAPAVMTLNARSARAQALNSCAMSAAAHPTTSHRCNPNPTNPNP